MACVLALVLAIRALSGTAMPPELAPQDSACGPDGVQSCPEASFGDSMLQTGAIRERLATATGAAAKVCKKLCRNARWVKWGTSWNEKCTVRQCKGCSECAGGPAPAPPAPAPLAPATPAPAPAAPAPPTEGPPGGPSSGECRNACRSDRFTKWGDTWPEKCQVKQCSGCAECAGGASAPTEAANHTGSTALGEIRSGEPLEVAAPSFHGWATASYSLFAPPAGLSVNRRTGKLAWQPDASQAGDHSVELDAVDGGGSGERRRHTITVRVVAAGSLPDGIYIWPSGGSDTSGRGTAASPFKTLQKATAAAKPGDRVFIRGGTYRLKLQALDNVKGSALHPVVITRPPGERVYILPHAAGKRTTFGFSVGTGCVGLTFRGLELDGEAGQNDVWSIVRKNWWRVEGGTFDVLGGANGFSIDGQHITVEDCVIHDCWSKAVDIPQGRYVTLRGNIIYNIGQYTVVGGAGIHRKWELNYKDPDDPRYYRFDISGNLIFNVEQRIPSFLPAKGFSDLVFDEGNSIGIWVTKDKQTKTRVANNAVLFPGKTGIHIMDNPNTEVLNNVVLTEKGRTDPVPRGIECPDRYGVDTTLTVKRNLVHSYPGGRAFAVSGHFATEDSPARVDGNYYSGGGELKDVPPAFRGTGDAPGIHNVSGSVFLNPFGLDLRPRADLPQDAGVDPSVLVQLFALAADYGVVVAPSGWRHDHVRMVEAILDAAPKDHVSGPTLAPSKKHKKHGREAYWYDVKSSFYRRLCKCNKLELIPSTSYWDHKLKKAAESSG